MNNMELTFGNVLELSEEWIAESRRRMRINYTDLCNFSQSNNIDYLQVFWFFKGCPVETDTFKAICDVLDLDWESVSV